MASDEDVEESFAGEEEEDAVAGPSNANSESDDGARPAGPGDDELEPEDRYRKKKGKKRKAKSEGKKDKKRKKKKKNDSEEESDLVENDSPDSDFGSSRKSGRKSKSSRHSSSATSSASTPLPAPPPAPAVDEASKMPSIEDVCSNYSLVDVAIKYSEQDFQNLSSYKLFQQHIRPLLAKDNPKVPVSKLMMLVAAKWREFSTINPLNEEPETDEPLEPDYVPKPSRSRGSVAKVETSLEEEDEDEDKGRKKRGSRSSKKAAVSTKKVASKVPTLKIKLGKRRRNSSDEEANESDKKSEGSDRDSDAEFEQMLQEAEEASPEAKDKDDAEATPDTPTAPRKAKTKFGVKNKRKPKRKANDGKSGEQQEHQDYCEACQQGGEIILCDTCPRAYHLVCLDPDLEDTPEGKWSCPHCETEGTQDQEEDEHNEFCRLCKDGGELLCCDSCTSAYHIFCLTPALTEVPDGDWKCPRCSAEPLPGKVSKILTWRWVEAPVVAAKADEPSTSTGRKTRGPKRSREYFVKWAEKSYWHCAWVSELQLDVAHPLMLRNYTRKYDMDEPPKLEDPIDESDYRMKRIKDFGGNDSVLEEKYYKYGIRPEWMMVHRVLNHRTMRDGRTLYLVTV